MEQNNKKYHNDTGGKTMLMKMKIQPHRQWTVKEASEFMRLMNEAGYSCYIDGDAGGIVFDVSINIGISVGVPE